MVRVCCLYRVSLLRQVDHVESNGQVIADIPMQKDACRHFCQQKKWSIVNEIQEQGISGYKNPTFDRIAVQEVLAAARAGQFDILLVYTLDRLSRRDSELPLLLSEMTECGVSVWSMQEGEMKYQTSTDRLLAYLYGWKANGESERISQRISTVQEQMTMRGQFRGGAVPFGYKLIENGEISKQGRKKHSLAIYEPEAEIVRFIFDQIDHEHITMYELTKLLAEYKFGSEVHEPKERDIVATRIKDRQFQRSLCDNGFYDQITRSFITDNCACLKGRGVDYTLNRLTCHLRRYRQKHGSEGWVLKCDIHHYFQSIMRWPVALSANG